MRIQFRSAKLQDLKTLIELENICFKTDRLSRSSFVHFIKSDKSDLIVAHNLKKELVGYFLVFYRRGTSLARLYSVAIHPKSQGRGHGEDLMEEVENTVRRRKLFWLRLEVRPDNKKAFQLYEKLGYHKFDVKTKFYDDSSEAYCLEKRLFPQQLGTTTKIPYYHQNTDFTCGPASLLMAMSALSKKIKPSLEEELTLWREATTIFMTSGHGGCGPRGLALAAHRRGFRSEIWLSQKDPLFVEGVRNQEKKEVLKIVYETFEKQIKRARIPVRYQMIKITDIEKALKKNHIPVVLISFYKLTKSKSPHWVVVAGCDDDHFYIHDPALEIKDKPSMSSRFLPDVAYMPVKKRDFLKMAHYGKSKAQTMILVGARSYSFLTKK